MSRQIAGFVTEFDKWGRFRITLPEVRSGSDRFNTRLQLESITSTGWSPLSKKSFLAKPARDCFAYDAAGRRVHDFAQFVQHDVILEVDFVTYDAGWWVRVASVRAE